MLRKENLPWLGKEPNQHVWYIYWRDRDTRRVKRRSSGTHDRDEAAKVLGKFIIDQVQLASAGPIETPDRYMIATALRWYLQEKGPEIASAKFAGLAVEYLIGFFGARAPVSNITPQVLKRYERERKRRRRVRMPDGSVKTLTSDKPISAGTIRRELSVLSAALNHAVDNGRLTQAPKIVVPPPPPNKTRYLERDEIERLLTECKDPHLNLFVLLALNTGARKGALLDLRWQQIDFANRIVYLNPEGRVQNNKHRAIVPINNKLYNALLKERDDLKRRKEERAKNGKPPYPPCDRVILYHGGPVTDIKIGFRNACKRAEIKSVTPHTLRHTAGTLMALAGIDLFLIAKVLGHSVQKTTELYAHFRPDYLREAVDALDKAMPQISAPVNFGAEQNTRRHPRLMPV